MAINSIGGINTISAPFTSIDKTQNTEKSGVSFSDYLKDAVNKTNDMIIESEKMAEDFAAGRTDNIHEVMISAEKADIALQFTMQIRNKIIEAYNEIMRIQI